MPSKSELREHEDLRWRESFERRRKPKLLHERFRDKFEDGCVHLLFMVSGYLFHLLFITAFWYVLRDQYPAYINYMTLGFYALILTAPLWGWLIFKDPIFSTLMYILPGYGIIGWLLCGLYLVIKKF